MSSASVVARPTDTKKKEEIERLIELTKVLPEWREVIEALSQRPLYDRFVGDAARARGAIPAPNLVFHSLQLLKPQDCRIVIFGQDPYPRAQSACGIAFYDRAIRTWDTPLCPSLRNIMKGVLIAHHKCDKSSTVLAIRQQLRESKVPEPEEWFHLLTQRGVLWLNTSLTYTSNEDLDEHIRFWAPVIDSIIRCVVRSRAPRSDGDNGVVFVLWGRKAESLKPRVQGIRADAGPETHIRFVRAPHPAVDQFTDVNSFRLIAKTQTRLGQKPINFLRPDLDVTEDSHPVAEPKTNAKEGDTTEEVKEPAGKALDQE